VPAWTASVSYVPESARRRFFDVLNAASDLCRQVVKTISSAAPGIDDDCR